MNKHYSDYFWKNGKPYGREMVGEGFAMSYKIIADPYYKRISIEKYNCGVFVKIIYDSYLFDFRKLKLEEQAVWQKRAVEETDEVMECHIRDQDDRLILIEKYRFQDQICRECATYSPHGLLLTVQKILYSQLGDSFNGVVLFDPEERMIMCKLYNTHKDPFSFAELLEEYRDMSDKPAFLIGVKEF